MKKSGVCLALLLVLCSGLVLAGSSSNTKSSFVVGEDAVGDKVGFYPVGIDSTEIDALDVAVFVIGGIAIIVVVILIVRRWLGKKPRQGQGKTGKGQGKTGKK